MVAGTHSGVGKTTVATGLMAALMSAGHRVASAKVGPDFIDPGYHQVATGRPGRNLDPFLCDPAAVPALAARAGDRADLLVVEGVMGLFDGVGATTEASTAAVAVMLDAPVLLVVDASAMSASVAPLVDGYHRALAGMGHEGVAGIVLNRVGSDTHESMLREALAPSGLPVLGALRRDPTLGWRERHLGLVPVVEDPAGVRRSVQRLGAAVARAVDLPAVARVARRAPTRRTGSPPSARRVPGPAVPVAVVGGPAFSFAYPDNLEQLVAAGAELLPFDPAEEPALPPGTRALYAGGGYPEVFVEALSANRPLRAEVRRRVAGGMATWAECGGLLWLAESLNGHPLCGAVAASGRMAGRITLGYRTATLIRDSPIGAAGAVLRGHELHYSTLTPAGDALTLTGRSGVSSGGWASPTLLASYLHLHLGSDPAPAETLVATAARSGAGASYA